MSRALDVVGDRWSLLVVRELCSAAVYELTESGEALRPVLDALSVWGAPRLGARRTTDAVRAHWFALPLGRAVAQLVPAGTVTVHIGETVFHYEITADGITHHDGPAPMLDREYHLALDGAVDVALGVWTLAEMVDAEAAEAARTVT